MLKVAQTGTVHQNKMENSRITVSTTMLMVKSGCFSANSPITSRLCLLIKRNTRLVIITDFKDPTSTLAKKTATTTNVTLLPSTQVRADSRVVLSMVASLAESEIKRVFKELLTFCFTTKENV